MSADYIVPALAAANILPVRERGHNGANGNVNVSSGIDFIQEKNKIVYSNADGLKVSKSMVFYARKKFALNIRENRPLNNDQLAAIMPRFATLIVMFEWLELWHAYGLNFTPRGGDLVSSAAELLVITNCDAIEEQLSKVWAYLNGADAGSHRDRFFKDKMFVIMCFFANCLHRDLDDGHNWRMTGDFVVIPTVMRSFKGKLSEIQAWMANDGIGHDTWHFMHDEDMFKIVDNMIAVGKPALAAPHIFNGKDVNGKTLRDASELKDTLLARSYRNSAIGGPLVALEWLSTAIINMALKAQIIKSEQLIARVESLKEKLLSTTFDVKVRNAIKTALVPVCAFSYGYLSINPTVSARMDEKVSAKKMAARNEQMSTFGTTLAKELGKMTTTAAALATSLTAIFATVDSCLRSMAVAMGVTDMATIDVQVNIEKSAEELSIDANKQRLAIEVIKANTEAANAGVNNI